MRNYVMLEGRVSKDPVVKEKVAYVSLIVSINDNYDTSEGKAMFVDFAVFGKNLERLIKKNVSKGDLINMSGRLSKNPNNNLGVVCDKFEVVSRPVSKSSASFKQGNSKETKGFIRPEDINLDNEPDFF